jgi:thiol-disulfide isomerase/thioredoxin
MPLLNFSQSFKLNSNRRCILPLQLAALFLMTTASPGFAFQNSEKLAKALAFKPRQPDVNYEQVTPKAMSECTIEEVVREDGKGFLVSGPGAVPLRWFVDTNKDNRLDRWCYFNHGVEVYRESDTDFNEVADEFRWLSTEGLRWGIDKDEDKESVIDSWEMISAEEATAELVRAVATRDTQRYARLLISDDEIKSLQLGDEKTNELLQLVRDAKKAFPDWSAGQNAISKQSKWTNFGADKPGIVPAGTAGSKQDIVVYENVVALTEEAGKPKQLLVGTMIQVGPVWRLIDLPKALSDGTAVNDTGRFFPSSFQPRGAADSSAAVGGISKEVEKLVQDLDAIDKKFTSLGGTKDNVAIKEKSVLHARRADVLEKLVSASTEPAERSNWVRQFADTIGAAAQVGEYPEGVNRLREFTGRLPKDSISKEDMAFVAFRTISADNIVRMQQPKADYDQVQKEYIEELEKFVDDYPTSPDAAEAMIQIALSAEFAGDAKVAEKWYAQTANKFGSTLPGQKARGATKRLNLPGKPFGIAGKTLDGSPLDSSKLPKVPTIYHCWASWCEECKVEMQGLSTLQENYGDKINIIGMNFDATREKGAAFIKQNAKSKQKFNWPHLHDDGLDSELAISLGILTLPVNIVVDANGKVVRTGAHWTELKGIIEGLQ